jgi:hypothetical protein
MAAVTAREATDLLIVYHIHDDRIRERILEFIKQRNHCMLSGSTYAIKTTEDPDSVAGALRELLEHVNNGSVYVFPIGRPVYGLGNKEANEWLKRSIPLSGLRMEIIATR